MTTEFYKKKEKGNAPVPVGFPLFGSDADR